MSEPSSRAPGPYALVFAGGDAIPGDVVEGLAPADLVIAADSGLERAQAIGQPVDLVIGDLDSVSSTALADAEARGASVERHPVEKDATDLELALDAALARGARRVTVIGGHGGRVDHFLANALLLASEAFSDLDIDAWIGSAHLTVVRTHAELYGPPGSLCTLLAVGGPAQGVTTQGLRFPLADEALMPGSTRGVSNVMLDSTATVRLRTGTLLAIQPHALEERT